MTLLQNVRQEALGLPITNEVQVDNIIRSIQNVNCRDPLLFDINILAPVISLLINLSFK